MKKLNNPMPRKPKRTLSRKEWDCIWELWVNIECNHPTVCKVDNSCALQIERLVEKALRGKR